MNCYKKTSASSYSAANIEEIITNKVKKNKEWTKAWFVRNQGSFATIFKELTVKQYTNHLKNYISGCQCQSSMNC